MEIVQERGQNLQHHCVSGSYFQLGWRIQLGQRGIIFGQYILCMFEILERLISACSSIYSCIKGSVRIFGLREAGSFAECILEATVCCNFLMGCR